MRQIEVVKQKIEQQSAGDRNKCQSVTARDRRIWARHLFGSSRISHGLEKVGKNAQVLWNDGGQGRS